MTECYYCKKSSNENKLGNASFCLFFFYRLLLFCWREKYVQEVPLSQFRPQVFLSMKH